MSDTDPATAEMYDPLLLITSVSLEHLSTLVAMQDELKTDPPAQRSHPYILDLPAMFLETYKRDSIWNADGRPIKEFSGKLAADNKTEMIAFGRRYRINPAANEDVKRLLKKPEGTIPLHRLHSPIGTAERTVHALLLLLDEQAERKAQDGRTKR
ncbi:hypothetical protein SH528x_003460 [Novipirellula sp. SH528]|uniref:hypothetical protein n=1 Tax=Novipirellula sp. SH528 TaxID=3454466 RepID=UPI003FA03DE4